MKIEVRAIPPDFQPFRVGVRFVVEAPEDAARLHALFNTNAITSWLNTQDSGSVREEIELRVPALVQKDAHEEFRQHLRKAYSK